MPYKGDYYGDYYRGDPGIFSSVGKFLGGVAKTAVSFVTGGPAAAASTALKELTKRPQPVTQTFQLPQPYNPPTLQRPDSVRTITDVGYPIFGGQTQTAYYSPNGCGTMCCVDGKPGRKNKSTYVTRGGGTSRWPQQLIVHPKGSECVRPRRMNPANPAALRRAIRRGRGAVKLLRGAAGAMGYTVVTKAALAKRPKARRRA